ncbi:MAG: hypothetical protein ABIG10_02255 [bacterium]
MFNRRRKSGNRIVTVVLPSADKKKKIIKTKLMRMVFIFFILGLLWLITLSDVFTLKHIVISNTKNISEVELESFIWEHLDQKKWYVFPQDNLIFLDKDWLFESLHENFQINRLRIKKRWPKGLALNLEEKDYSMVWHENETYYYINRNGDIILESFDCPEDIIIINNLDELKKEGRSIVIEGKYLDSINGLHQQITAALSDLPIQQYVIDGEVNTFKLKVEEGPLLYFNTEEAIAKQVNKLVAVKKEIMDSAFYNKLYIDLRYGDKVFYK